MFGLSGKTAVVTGAQGKLGQVWARTLVTAGAHVVALDLPGSPRMSLLDELGRDAGKDRLTQLDADVRDRASLEAALSIAIDRVGTPDVLVNNAGIDQPPALTRTVQLEDLTADAFSTVLAVNVIGAFHAIQVFGGAMVAAGKVGSIVNIGSLYASVSPDARLYDHIAVDPPFLKPPAYGASKAALLSLTRYFATHWAKHRVRVNALSPGGVIGAQDPAFVEKYCSRVPMGRMAAEPDLGGPLLFLASDASSYVTGIDLKVDGGFTAW